MSTLESSARRGVALVPVPTEWFTSTPSLQVTGDLALAGPGVRRGHHADPLRHEHVRLAGAERGRKVDHPVLVPVQVAQVHDQPADAQPVPAAVERESMRLR